MPTSVAESRRRPSGRSRTPRPPGSRARPLTRPRARLRRALAALLAAVAVGGGTHLALNRPVAGTVPVLVAAVTVPVGAALEGSGLEVRHLPEDVLPEGAVRERVQVQGRSAASVLSPGEVVTVHDLSAEGLLAGRGTEAVATFLPLGEPALLAAVTAGSRVDVHSPVDGTVVVGGVVVLARQDGERGGIWLALSRAQATALAAARGADPAGGSLIVSVVTALR